MGPERENNVVVFSDKIPEIVQQRVGEASDKLSQLRQDLTELLRFFDSSASREPSVETKQNINSFLDRYAKELSDVKSSLSKKSE